VSAEYNAAGRKLNRARSSHQLAPSAGARQAPALLTDEFMAISSKLTSGPNNFRVARQPEVTKALIPTSGLPVIEGTVDKAAPFPPSVRNAD